MACDPPDPLQLAHHYDDIQRTLVWETLVRDLPGLRAQLERLIRTLEAERDLGRA